MSDNSAPGGPAGDRPGGPPDPDHRATGSQNAAAARGGRHASSGSRRRVPVLAAVGVVLVLLAGGIGVRAAAGSADSDGPALATAQPSPADQSEPATATRNPGADPTWGPVTGQSPVAAPTDRVADGVRPTGVRIPAIGVDATSLVPLTILPRTGELEAPVKFEQTGWYAAGPVPGEAGPAVIAAHVDSKAGPAVFFRLKAGDLVYVPRSDGVTVTFTVTGVERYPKNAFPTQKVHGPTPDRALRLITCGGSFDYAKRSYRDNIVVYAVRA